MKVFLTGGAGFIGSSLVDRLLSNGLEVVALDNFDPYYSPELKRENLASAKDNPNFSLIEGDIRDFDLVRSAMEGADAVIHEAAQPGVRVSVDQPLKTSDVNFHGSASVLTAAKDLGINKIVMASSSSVYGEIDYLPFDENHPLKPLSPYGVSKASCESLANVFSKLYGLVIPQLRYFTVYGPRLRPDLAINIFMHKAMKNEPFTIFGDGSKTRSFTYISDVIDATLLALEKGKTGPYNIGGENNISIKDLAEKIIAITDSASKIEYSGNVVGDVQHTWAKNDKARDELGWSPKVDIDEGLKKYYEWVKARK